MDMFNDEGCPIQKIAYYLFLGSKQIPVCCRFFLDVYGVPTTFPKSCQSIESSPRNKPRPIAELIIAWFTDIQKFHEYMPDLTGAGRRRADELKALLNNDEPPNELVAAPMIQTGVQLSYPTKQDVFDHFKKDWKDDPDGLAADQQAPSYTHFRQVWKQEFPHVRLRKHLRFAKCDTCIFWREKIGAFDRRDENKRSKDRATYRCHLTDIRQEREYYHAKRREAARCNSDSLSIIFDGADQGAYCK